MVLNNLQLTRKGPSKTISTVARPPSTANKKLDIRRVYEEDKIRASYYIIGTALSYCYVLISPNN